MRKRLLAILAILVLFVCLLAGCGEEKKDGSAATKDSAADSIEDVLPSFSEGELPIIPN